jgi:hypothetical protein
MSNVNVSLLSKKAAILNSALDALSQYRYIIDNTGMVPNSISVAYENIYALTYHELKRAEVEIEHIKSLTKES